MIRIRKIFPAPVDVGGITESWLVTATIKRKDGYKEIVVAVSSHTSHECGLREGFWPRPSVGNAKELKIEFDALNIGEEIELTDPEEEKILQRILEVMEIKPSN